MLQKTDSINKFNYVLNQFKIKASCVDYYKLHKSTCYEIKLDPMTKIKSLEKYANEITLALQVAERLEKESGGKFGIRVVSMPSTTVFDQQDAAYKAKVLPAKIPRIAVEAGVSDFWWKYGCAAVHGVDTFGESAPANQLYEYFGLTVDQIAKTVKQCIAQK